LRGGEHSGARPLDKGPEFVAKLVLSWFVELGVATLFIEPGSPWDNGGERALQSATDAQALTPKPVAAAA
jgi:transposase InsO family protein